MATTKVAIFDPNAIMRDAQNFVGINKVFLIILAVLIACIAGYMLYVMYSDYTSMSAKERSFRRGKSSFMATLRVELLERMKKKRKRPM